jgi:hypothetical protein
MPQLIRENALVVSLRLVMRFPRKCATSNAMFYYEAALAIGFE